MNNWKISFSLLLLLPWLLLGGLQGQTISDKVDVLVIDPGHGGDDPGCVGKKKTREKDVVLAVALKYGKLVQEAFPDVKVIYTRSDDRFIELWKRGQIANDHHADLFVSIHCNAAKSPSANGVETWLRGTQKDDANLAEVQRENAVVYKEKNHEKNYSQGWMDIVAATLHQDAGFGNSIYFAQELQNLYKKNINASPSRGIKQGPFYVLWKSARPSVLTEIGFLSNPEEEAFLSSEEGQNKVAHCLFDAFAKYKRKIDRRCGLDVPEPEEKPVVEEKPEVAKKEEPKRDTVKENKAPLVVAADSVAEPVAEPQTKPLDTLIPIVKEKTIEYRVQLAASGLDLDLQPHNFGGLSDLSKYHDPKTGMNKYYHSRSSTREGIENALKKAKASGFPSAFVVMFEDDVPVSVKKQAKE